MTLQRYEHTGAAPGTTLNGSITAGATVIAVQNGTGYPTGGVGPFVIKIDAGMGSEEKILCLSRSGNTINVVTSPSSGRGYDGTTASSHGNGAAVEHDWSAAEADDASDHIYTTTRDDHTQYAKTDGSRAITGAATFNSGVTVTGNETVGGTLGVTGGTTLSSTLAVTGVATLSGNATVGGTLGVTGALTGSSTVTGTALIPSGLTGSTAAGRFVGVTASGAPSTGAHLVGDFAFDQTGAMFVCITAGTPGTWSVPVGGLLNSKTGPASQTDYLSTPATVLTQAVSLVNGNTYMVTITLAAASQATTSGLSQVYMSDSAGYLPSAGNEVRALWRNMDASEEAGGSASWTFTATSTASDTFTVLSSATAGALRIPANNVQFNIVRVG